MKVKKQRRKTGKEMKKMNVGESDLVIRFFIAISLMIYGIAGGLDAPVAFDPSQHHWLIIGIEPVMGTLSLPFSLSVIGLSLFVLYTAATRYCIVYPALRINTCHAVESH